MPAVNSCHRPSFPLRRSLRLFIGVVLLLAGCLIYFSWRDEHINLCVWTNEIGFGFLIEFLHTTIGRIEPGSFVRDSLPDGLYCLAYILIMDCVWERSKLSLRVLMAMLIPLLAIIHEILQCCGVVAGTFDTADLFCYLLPVLTYLSYIILNTITLKTGKKPAL